MAKTNSSPTALVSSDRMVGLSTAFVALAALCWGLSGGIGRILTGDGWDPVVVSFYRGAIGFLFVLAWLALRPRGSGLANGRLWLWSMVAGVGVAGNFAFYFISIAEGSVAVAATLMYSAPVFVYLVSFTLKLEQPTLFKWVAIVMVMFGVVLLTGIYEIGAGDVTLIAAGAGCCPGCLMRSSFSASNTRSRTAAPRPFSSSRSPYLPLSCSSWGTRIRRGPC